MSTEDISPTGRPTVLTEQLIADICAYIEKGVPLKYAAHANGITEEALAKWDRKGREDVANDRKTIHSRLVAARERAHAKFLSTQAMVVMKHAVGFDTRDGGRREGDWRAGAWLLERRGGADWVPQAQVEISGGVDVNHGGSVRHEVVHIPDDAQRLQDVADVLGEIGVLALPAGSNSLDSPDNLAARSESSESPVANENGQNGAQNGSNGRHPHHPEEGR
jgi:hypothetical protein